MNSTHGYGLELAQIHTEANQKPFVLTSKSDDKFTK